MLRHFHSQSAKCLALALVLALAGTSAEIAKAEDKPDFQDQVVEQVNSLRTNPKAFAAQLRPRLDWFDGMVMRRPGAQVGLLTKEGAAAVTEAINALEAIGAAPALTFSPSLSIAANELAVDQSQTGATGHVDSRGGTSQARITKGTTTWKAETQWTGGWAECCSYGNNDPFEIIAQLVIDDGNPSRGHRNNLLDANLAFVGLDLETHPVYRYVCVLDFARGFGRFSGERMSLKYRFTFTNGGSVIAYLVTIGSSDDGNGKTDTDLGLRHLNGKGDEFIHSKPNAEILKKIEVVK